MNKQEITEAHAKLADVINKAHLWGNERSDAWKALAALTLQAGDKIGNPDCKCCNGYLLQMYGHWYNTASLTPPVERPAVTINHCPECGRKL